MRLYPEADVILMVIRLNLICTYNKNRLIGVLIAIAYPFLLLRLDNSLLYFQLPVNFTSGGVYVNSCKFTPLF